MRKLHLVGFTPDNTGLVFAARRGAKSGGFVVALDPELLEQIDVARRSRRGGAGFDTGTGKSLKIESALTPREIQARMRTGRTVEEVAAEAGVTIEWVERFAAPVFAEQAAAVARASELAMETPRRGASDRPLARAVFRNLVLKGVRLTDDEFASSWSAHLTVDNEWLVTFRFFSHGRAAVAEWIFDAKAGRLTAHNRIGSDLGYVDSGTRPANRPQADSRARVDDTVPPSGDARRAARALKSVRDSESVTSKPRGRAGSPPAKAGGTRRAPVPAKKRVADRKAAPARQETSAARKTSSAKAKRATPAPAKTAKKPGRATTARTATPPRPPVEVDHRPLTSTVPGAADRLADITPFPVAPTPAPDLGVVASNQPGRSAPATPRRPRPLRAPRFANAATPPAPEAGVPAASVDVPTQEVAVVVIPNGPDLDPLRPPNLQEIPVPPPLPPARRRRRFDDLDLGVEYIEAARRRVGIQLS